MVCTLYTVSQNFGVNLGSTLVLQDVSFRDNFAVKSSRYPADAVYWEHHEPDKYSNGEASSAFGPRCLSTPCIFGQCVDGSCVCDDGCVMTAATSPAAPRLTIAAAIVATAAMVECVVVEAAAAIATNRADDMSVIK